MRLPCVGRLLRDTRGATAIEYAITLPIVLLIIMGILEFSIMLYVRSTIEETTRSVARIAITKTGNSNGSLSSILKERLKAVVLDPAALTINSRAYDTYQSFNSDMPNNGITSPFGKSDTIMRYTVTYNYKFLTPLPILFNRASRTVLIQSTVFAKNEVF
jgi:Flp pilus assembly protein TadG